MSSPPTVDLEQYDRSRAQQQGPAWTFDKYDTDELLAKGFLFFEVQESGKLRPGHRVKWAVTSTRTCRTGRRWVST